MASALATRGYRRVRRGQKLLCRHRQGHAVVGNRHIVCCGLMVRCLFVENTSGGTARDHLNCARMGRTQQIVGREPRSRVSYDALLNSRLALPRGRVNSDVRRLAFDEQR